MIGLDWLSVVIVKLSLSAKDYLQCIIYARDSVVGWGNMLQAGRLNCSTGVYSASNRNEYQESAWGLKRGRCIRLTASPQFLSRLSRNVISSTSHNPLGIHGLLQEILGLINFYVDIPANSFFLRLLILLLLLLMYYCCAAICDRYL
jgi:hypothetical protein